METCRQAALCACAVSLAYGILSHLLPTERFAKQLRLILTLLLLIALIQPFLHQDVSLPALAIQEDSQSAYTQQYTQALIRQTEAHLADALLEQLEAAGVACQKVQVEIHIDQQGGIDIREVRLQCADFQAAVTKLHRTLGADITITEVDVW